MGTQVPQFCMEAVKVLGTPGPQFYMELLRYWVLRYRSFIGRFKVMGTQVSHFN